MTKPKDPPEIARKRPRAERRFKVQRRVEIRARDAGNNPMIVGKIWDTIAQAAKASPAEQIYEFWRRQHPNEKVRLVEERPFGLTQRVLLPRPTRRPSIRR